MHFSVLVNIISLSSNINHFRVKLKFKDNCGIWEIEANLTQFRIICAIIYVLLSMCYTVHGKIIDIKPADKSSDYIIGFLYLSIVFFVSLFSIPCFWVKIISVVVSKAYCNYWLMFTKPTIYGSLWPIFVISQK